MKKLCVCAIKSDEGNGYECGITGCSCMYPIPNQDACADTYGEVSHTAEWEEEHGNS